jgi:hypothetical protein
MKKSAKIMLQSMKHLPLLNQSFRISNVAADQQGGHQVLHYSCEQHWYKKVGVQNGTLN